MEKLFVKMFISLALLACVVSCKDEPPIRPNETGVKAMVFTSSDDFSTMIGKIGIMNSKELDDMEQKYSFVSMRSVLHAAYSELENARSEDDYKSILKKYDDVLTIRDSTVTPYIDNTILQSFVNREGIYQTENHYNKVIGNHIASAKIEDYNKLKELRLSDAPVSRHKEIKFLSMASDKETIEDGRVNIACSNSMTVDYFDNPSGCKNDRRVYVKADRNNLIGVLPGNTYYWVSYARVSIHAEKRNSFCNWSTYQNPLNRSTGSFSSTYWNGYGWDNYSTSIPAGYADAYSLDWGHTWGPTFYVEPPVGQFTSISVSGTSQGVGNNWAVLTCP